MPPIPDEFAQANLIYTGSSVPNGAQVTFAFDAVVFGGTPAAAATAIGAAYVASTMDTETAVDVNLASTLVKFGPDATGPSAEVATVSLGADAAAAAPNTAWLVHKNTALGGRSGRGRFYFPGVPESEIAGAGTLLSAKVTSLQNAINGFITNLAAADINLYLLHEVGAPITTPTAVTSVTVDQTVATQRRRLRR